ncbi:zf-HC2 domain-containing protein [Symbioplanes lichenis]|uniref:zf-HC2 domain-containing protein n=1 Tax=Symbioplanes lichenis TaxID=1629072 RepID=UPI002739F4FA|nr:zf-HC2 domain-containing protein [Actinoplanes lichenis]
MACEQWREMLSAQLDGEDDPGDRARVDEHLAGCAGCREWLDRAAMVNRLSRTGLVTDVPDLSGSIMAALGAAAAPAGPSAPTDPSAPAASAASPAASASSAFPAPAASSGPLGRVRAWWHETRSGDWRPRATAALYVALAVVGAVQLILGLAQVGGGSSSLHVHTGLDATPGHLWHESAAWNVAVGAGYLFIALRRSRPTGLVPMLTAFVGMLLLLSVNDLSAARVDAERLVSHGFVILGYLLVVALSRVAGGTAQPPGDRITPGLRWHLVEEDDEAPAVPRPPRLRLLPGGPLTAHHTDGFATPAPELFEAVAGSLSRGVVAGGSSRGVVAEGEALGVAAGRGAGGEPLSVAAAGCACGAGCACCEGHRRAA